MLFLCAPLDWKTFNRGFYIYQCIKFMYWDFNKCYERKPVWQPNNYFNGVGEIQVWGNYWYPEWEEWILYIFLLPIICASSFLFSLNFSLLEETHWRGSCHSLYEKQTSILSRASFHWVSFQTLKRVPIPWFLRYVK